MSNTLVDNLSVVVDKNPDAIALVNGDESVTYSVLWEKISKVTQYLIREGLNRGDRVAILLNNSIEYVATYYGVLAAGGVSVSLNIAVRFRELSTWIDHSGARWLVADGSHTDIQALLKRYSDELNILLLNSNSGIKFPREIKYLDAVLFGEDFFPKHILKPVSGDDTAAIIYTSGTTGSPKGVVLSHANMYKNTISILEYLKLCSADSIVNVLPFFYSYGNSILHTHLAVGAKLVLFNSMVFPKLVLDIIQKEHVSGFSGVPSTFALLLNRANIHNYDLSSLRYVTQAGGPMPPANIQKFLKLVPNVEFVVMYGQTEATARLSYLPPERLHEKMGSVGIAIPGVKLVIRDKFGNKTKPKEIGEIFASGENIMQGYWKAPDKTEKAIKNGWLRTGDLAYYDQDEYIYIVGRSTDMIKTGANRVSPKDIEEVLASLDGIVEAAVIGIDDGIMGQVIKAYIVKEKSSNLDRKKIMSYCKDNLAAYKIPKYIEFVDDLPKTSSGKVQRFMLQ